MSREAYSRNLWFNEGVANYSADMLLLRSKILNSTEYFLRATAELDALQHQAGRLIISLEESSWNTWTRSENSVNAIGLLHPQGKDRRTAARRGNTRAAPPAQRVSTTCCAVWSPLLQAKRRTGLDDNALETEIQAATGVNVREIFDSVVRGKSEIDYKRYLENIGIFADIQKDSPFDFFRNRVRARSKETRRASVVWFPALPRKQQNSTVEMSLLAMDSERVTFDNIASRIHSKPSASP